MLKRLFLLALLAVSGSAKGPADLPEWARPLTALPAPKAEREATAVLLMEETLIDVAPTGTATTTRRKAIRLLSNAGASWAKGSVHYLEKTEKVRQAQIWIYRGHEVVKELPASRWTDVSLAGGLTLQDETLRKEINVASETTVGDLVFEETIVEEPLFTAQFSYTWGWAIPALSESFQMRVPAGFRLALASSGTGLPEPEVSEQNRTWRWRKTEGLYYPPEPDACGFRKVAPRLYVQVIPPERQAFAPAVFRTWGEIAEWGDRAGSPRCDTSPELAAAARQLAANAPDRLSQIRAVGAYVQNLRYVAINRNLGRGGGYVPRKASEVFAKGFGDCKDKANLLRSLLRELGIPSYPMIVNLDDDQAVNPAFPSPSQFNHAILAIEVDDSVQLPAVVTVGERERYLLFDPTDMFTAPGDLGRTLQLTQGMILRPGAQELVTLPRVPWSETRTARLVLQPDGVLMGKLTIQGERQAGATLRRELFGATAPKEKEKLMLSFLGDGLRGAGVRELLPNDNPIQDRVTFDFDVTRKAAVQHLPGGLMVVRMDLFTRAALPVLTAKERVRPVDLKALAQEDEVEIALPVGVAAEELPAPQVIESPYGTYRRSLALRDRRLICKRSVQLLPQVVSVEDYPKLRQFLSDLGKADRATVVLKNGG